MNWLQIARRVRKECGLSGTDSSPTSVIGQTGEMLAIVNWVDSAWRAIQGQAKWDWLWEEADLTLTAGDSTIAGTIAHDRYIKDTMRSGSQSLTYLPWADFRAQFPAVDITAGTPTYWTVKPDKTLAFSAEPESDMSLTVERYAAPTGVPSATGADDEAPAMPADHHEAIVWRAVMFYAGHDEAGVIYQHAQSEFKRIMGRATIEGLPSIELGAPLA